jgi:predicted  nucleic acid-binding Zn-ribbon protein
MNFHLITCHLFLDHAEKMLVKHQKYKEYLDKEMQETTNTDKICELSMEMVKVTEAIPTIEQTIAECKNEIQKLDQDVESTREEYATWRKKMANITPETGAEEAEKTEPSATDQHGTHQPPSATSHGNSQQ